LTFQVTSRTAHNDGVMAEDELADYERKRDFERTTEPKPGGRGAKRTSGVRNTPRSPAGRTAGSPTGAAKRLPRFVVQEHHARRLHWDLRLEHEGVAASWAIPNGIPPTPKENRLAVHTEDHPLEYLEWEGEIPRGQYGAGTMSIWDRGTYEPHKWEERKVEVTFHGERLRGRYGLFPIGRGPENASDWMIHRLDPPEDPDRAPFPDSVKPMLARMAKAVPADEARWSYEVKWDGVRAIAYARPGRLRLESRNGRDITDGYPEIRGLLEALGMTEAIFDGEIVAFDENGRPSFERLQQRMHVRGAAQVKRLQKSTPVVYAIFDLLFLDGESLLDQPYEARRARLNGLQLGGPAWRVPENYPGFGHGLLEATRRQGLEGIIAKRLDSGYYPGARNGCWLKIKNVRRQELVIGGWLPGEGRRAERIGALLVGYHDNGDFRYAGRVGTGFTDTTLDDLARRLQPLQSEASPFTPRPKLPRNTVYVEPELVAEVEFVEWTREGVLRAPSFKGLRDDKDPGEVVREEVVDAEVPSNGTSDEADDLFDTVEELPKGGLAVTIGGRSLKLSNWDKVLFPATGFTKGDLITYYARVAPAVLPHLRDRALTLKRYPNGVEGGHFYEKQSPVHRPGWIPTRMINDVNYTLANEPATLVWLANLADIELHTSLAHADAPERPTLLVFDLDPGAPAGIVECCEVALVLRGLFDGLGLRSVAKTSGSKGVQVYVPLGPGRQTYDLTKPFAKRIAELLEQRMPELVVSRMAKNLRAGKVLVDWSQNDQHKTTATVYSVRALARPGVSTPVAWDELERCRAEGRPELLSFSPEEVLERVQRLGDLFAPAAELCQTLPPLQL
jgi:bifunctional non-homologous end joining protein LigD